MENTTTLKENPNYYAILTAEVRYCKELSAQEKLLYSEITALTNKKGYCWATNNYFAELYGLSKETVSRQVSNLAKHGFIHLNIIYYEDSKQIKERRIYLTKECMDRDINTPYTFTAPPIDENVNTPIDKNADTPIDVFVNTPIDENVKGNNQIKNNLNPSSISNINQSAELSTDGNFPTQNDTIDINIINHAIENNIPLESLKDKYSNIEENVKDYLDLLIEAYKRKPYYNLLKINIEALDIHSIKKIVAGNISLDDLINDFPTFQKEIKELYNLISETLYSKKKTFRIAKEELPAQIVKESFCVLNYDLMRYVVESLMKNTTEVKNPKAFLLTTIYNAHKTYNNHFSLEYQSNLENNGFFIKQA